jgi:hypothetical protein
VKVKDEGGGVFVPSPEKRILAPVYAFGHPDAKTKSPVFTCPVSAIPPAAWELLDLWIQCRAMGALPFAGGVLDQPLIVRRSFPVFEGEAKVGERAVQAHTSAAGAAAIVGAMFGGGRR